MVSSAETFREEHVQELGSLGEAHGVVPRLQSGVLGQLAAHHGHLLVHVQEETVLRVLQGTDGTFTLTGKEKEPAAEQTFPDETCSLDFRRNASQLDQENLL